ncbi:Rrf2 family transcriptional regulator [Aequorivita sp. SDUM287046]|uniref:Rrf2 family transcriptional regulator n=1 Tax=Aequorivita aurantiaca TaxID=3053356 RepID=A0ABT8DFQ4_9FLAO|nr:Rrf2 family transcriptional regulator [Aequorivita aurantiaca]MDN3724181.1 Rrf2 family transcriptional regulator [Aequorivita aurantiaca]
MFSKACEYGIRSVLFIAEQSQMERRPTIVDIANAIGSPLPFTAKICQQLARSGIIISKKGPNGGFHLPKDATLTLADIVVSIDGQNIFSGCILGMPECSAARPCPVHDQYNDIRKGLKSMCENTTVMQLSEKLRKGETFLKF